MKQLTENPVQNDSVIIAVNGSGRMSIHSFIGSFSGEAAHELFENVKQANDDREFDFPPHTYWQVGVEYDDGDPSVGLPALGHILDASRMVQLPWAGQNHPEIF